MKLFELKGLDVKTLSPLAVSKKHNVSLKQIERQLAKGVKVEREHTTNELIAREIALDHISEFPDYYDRLAKVETLEPHKTT